MVISCRDLVSRGEKEERKRRLPGGRGSTAACSWFMGMFRAAGQEEPGPGAGADSVTSGMCGLGVLVGLSRDLCSFYWDLLVCTGGVDDRRRAQARGSTRGSPVEMLTRANGADTTARAPIRPRMTVAIAHPRHGAPPTSSRDSRRRIPPAYASAPFRFPSLAAP